MKCGAQLYTVRDFCRTPEDFAETLKKIADIGYTEVQVSGTCAYQPEWLKEQLESTGLSCVITHYDINMIKNDPVRAVRENAVFGCRHIGIGSMPGGASGLENFDAFVSDYLPAAEKVKENGGYLMYHNHHFEFNHVSPGVTYLERLAEIFPAETLGFTLDTYWVQVGGGSPCEWLRRLSGRVPCIHLKDLAMSGTEQHMAAVGCGNINFDSVLAAASDAGTEHLLVEQDDCYGEDQFGELKKSYLWLRSRGIY